MHMSFGAIALTEHTLTVPLVWPDLAGGDEADDRTIDIFARVVTRSGGEDLPYLVFLQGGPGNEDPRPGPDQAAWIDAALEDHRVVLLDQRGTGRSTPVGDDFLEGRSAEEVAEHLTHLRADSIVRDAEAVREHLGAKTWRVLGQSFGGFTLLHYLSYFADSVERAYFTGGLSAVGRHCDDVYRLCYDRMRELSLAHYRRFPEDRDRMRRVVEFAERGEIVLPDGEVLSASRARNLGHLLGSDNGWARLHWLLELDPGSNAFRHDLANAMAYGGRNPLYYVFHESSYADGCVTDWSAQRVEPDDFREDVTLLTGEHVREEWCDTVPAFQPWAEVTRILAKHEWPQLYDAEALAASGAIGAAAVYVNDAYVPLEFSRETGALLPGVKQWITSEYEHSGLRTSGRRVVERLFALADGRALR